MNRIITTDKLILRPIQAEDAAEVYRYSGDPGIDMMMFLPHGSLAEAVQFAARSAAEWQTSTPEDMEYVILLDDRIIGGVNLERCPEPGHYEIGWILHRDFRGKGYATEAAKALLAHAFDTLQAVMVQAHCDSRNAASRHVMEKLNMRLLDDTGTRTYPRTGIVSGELLFAVTKEAFR